MKLGYLLGEAFTNLRRNLLIVLAAILAVFISLSLAFGAVVVNEMVGNTTARWQEGVRIAAFLRDDIGLQTEQELRELITSWDEVDEVSYVSKSEAYEEFQEMFRSQPALVEDIDPSKLPASFRISLVDPEAHQVVANRLEGLNGIYRVRSASEAIDNLLNVSRILNLVFVGTAVLLGVASIVLITNTIRMAIFARRDEVAIMKLVGAGNWFIRIPFVLEGLIEGLVGSVLAVGAVWLLYRASLSQIGQSISLVSIDISPDFLAQWAAVVLAFGAIAGALGSGIALRRFLRV